MRIPQGEVRFPDTVVHLSTGQDGDIFAVIGTVTGALRKDGHGALVEEFVRDIFASDSYTEALHNVMQWVTVT